MAKTNDYQFQPKQYVASYKQSGMPRRKYGRLVGVPESTLRTWEATYEKPSSRLRVSPVKAKVVKEPEIVYEPRYKTSNLYEELLKEANKISTAIRRIKQILSEI
jgi:hypothetical protein